MIRNYEKDDFIEYEFYQLYNSLRPASEIKVYTIDWKNVIFEDGYFLLTVSNERCHLKYYRSKKEYNNLKYILTNANISKPAIHFDISTNIRVVATG